MHDARAFLSDPTRGETVSRAATLFVGERDSVTARGDFPAAENHGVLAECRSPEARDLERVNARLAALPSRLPFRSFS